MKKNNMKIGLAVKITLTIVFSIAMVSVASNSILYYLSCNALRKEIKDKILVMAANAAFMIDAEKLKAIRNPNDEGSETYLELQRKLEQIKKSGMGKIRYIYTLQRRGDEYSFVLDSSPIDDKKNHSSIGDKFDIEAFPMAAEGFAGPVVEEGPSPDKEFGGAIQSGYAPIKDKNGAAIGAVGVDIDVTTLQQEEAEMKQARALSLALALVLALATGLPLSRYLARPILVLNKGTKSLAEGDFDVVVDINRGDELGQLADSFNSMAMDLKMASDGQKRHSLELEEKVQERTEELSRKNSEIEGYLVKIQDEKKRADDLLTGIIPIGISLFAEKDFGRLLESILLESMNFCNADAGSLYLLTEDNKLEFSIVQTKSKDMAFGGTSGREIPYTPIPMYSGGGAPNDQNVVAGVAHSRSIVNISDIYMTEEYEFGGTKKFDEENHYRTTSLLTVPLMSFSGENVMGVLQLINAMDWTTGQVARFSQHQEKMTTILSRLAATALESYLRQQKLNKEIQELRFEIDHKERDRRVKEITDTDYFQAIQDKVAELRGV